MSERRRALRTSIAISSALAACEPDPIASPSGEHVDFTFEDEARELCAGSVPRLDRYLESAFGFFDMPTPEDFRVPVHVVGASLSCSASTACYIASERTIYLSSLDPSGRRTSGVLRHELSHAVIDRIWGQSAPFFEEGLAESLSRTLDWGSGPDVPVPVGDMLGGVPREVDYTAAAYFTRFLIDTRGLARFKQLFQGARDRSQDEIRALMAEIYGVSFEALEAEYLSGEPRCQYQVDLCDPRGAVAVGQRFHVVHSASCHDPDFYGSAGSDDMLIATQHTLAVEAPGAYRLRTSYDVPPLSSEYLRSQIVLTRCGGCDEQFVRLFHRTDEELELEAGLYALEIVMPFDTVVTVELEPAVVAP